MDLRVGQRYLIKVGLSGFPYSIEVLEIAPSGKHVQVKYEASGNTAWLKQTDFYVIERLGAKATTALEDIAKTLFGQDWHIR